MARVYPRRRKAFRRLLEGLHTPQARRAFLLLGPRQVGKSVLLGQIADALLEDGWPAPNLTHFDFSDERCPTDLSLRQVLEFEPPGFRREHPRILLLDEVSRSRKWDQALKQAVDRSRRLDPGVADRILATDSAASILRTGSQESGQGRFENVKIAGLSAQEFLHLQGIGEEDARHVLQLKPGEIERYLSLGGFPEHIRAEPGDQTRRQIREDICDRAIGRDLSRRGVDTDRVHALFVALVQDSGGVFEAAGRSRDIDSTTGGRGTDPRTIQGWVKLLEDAGLLVSLSPRDGAARDGPMSGSRRLRARPKLYAADHGMVPAFSPHSDPMAQSDVRAKTLECAVLLHLRVLAEERGFALSYFRNRDRHELDFVLDFANRSLAIEVTTRSNPLREIAVTRAAASEAGIEDVLLIHGGYEVASARGVRLVPYTQFFMDPDFLWGSPS